MTRLPRSPHRHSLDFRFPGLLVALLAGAAAFGLAWAVARPEKPHPLARLAEWLGWGPRVQVGERTFRVNVRPDPGRPVRLVVWDAVQPVEGGARAWESVLRGAVQAVRRRYPAVEVEIRLLRWQEMDQALQQALSRGEPPDILGTTDGTYLFDPSRQVPLHLYLQHALDPALRREVLPGALALASDGATLWGVPRWVEWVGWVAGAGSKASPAAQPVAGRQQTSAAGSQPLTPLALDLANPLAWRLLVEAAPQGGEGLPGGPPTPDGAVRPDEGVASAWSPERVHAATAWAEAARPKLVNPWRVAEAGLLQLVRRGEARAAGPVTGRLAYRVGLWPAGRRERPAGARGLEGLRLADAPDAGLPPGPFLFASSYVLFVRPETDDGRLRLAWELAVQLARDASAALASMEGVIPAWNPEAPSALEARPPGGRAPSTRAGADPTPWWERYPFPPGAAALLTRTEPPALLGGLAGRAGVRPWADALHQHGPVAEAALSLSRGRMSLDAFARRITRTGP